MHFFNRQIATLTKISLIFLICYYLSLTFWKYYSPNITLNQSIINPVLATTEASQLVNLFATYALFGVPPVVKVPPVTKRPAQRRQVKEPNPKVQLEVKGILFGSKRYAILHANGVEETYTVGEYISYLYIKEIGKDYVVFDDDGVLQKVYVLDGPTSVGGNSGVSGETVQKTAATQKLTAAS